MLSKEYRAKEMRIGIRRVMNIERQLDGISKTRIRKRIPNVMIRTSEILRLYPHNMSGNRANRVNGNGKGW